MAEEWYVEGVISKMFTIESKLFVAPRHLVAKSPSIDSVYEQNGWKRKSGARRIFDQIRFFNIVGKW